MKEFLKVILFKYSDDASMESGLATLTGILFWIVIIMYSAIGISFIIK